MKVKVNELDIKVSKREKGKGYSGTLAFEMVLHKKFAKVLEQTHNNVYN